MAGMNLLAAIIIYWNTDLLGKTVAQRKRAGLDCSAALLAKPLTGSKFIASVQAIPTYLDRKRIIPRQPHFCASWKFALKNQTGRVGRDGCFDLELVAATFMIEQ